jgi:formamidopyrimidine-DNA glycosylase
MPELPEIYSRAKEMNSTLPGRVIREIEVIQPKSLNIPEADFNAALIGAQIADVTYRGKWIFVETDRGCLLINLGMGGEILLTTPKDLPEKRRLVFHLEGPGQEEKKSLSINFWWFGYAHYVPSSDPDSHSMTARLGPNAIDLDPATLKSMLVGQRTRVKNWLLDQSKIAGIGNAYIHDILFLAKLHPMRKMDTLSEQEIENLASAIQKGLKPAVEKGGAYYEVNLFGEKGGFQMEDIIIGYREGSPCPVCSTPIEKIKTGSNSSFICTECQPL